MRGDPRQGSVGATHMTEASQSHVFPPPEYQGRGWVLMLISTVLCLAMTSIASAQQTRPSRAGRNASRESQNVQAEHDTIGVASPSASDAAGVRNTNPDAQWYPDGSFGLFIHW